MKNIFLEIEYKGTNYFGFQIQNKNKVEEITIQEALENVLESLFRKKIRIHYPSRTDRGVHALGQIVNFKVKTTIPLKNIKNVLNERLPKDIRVKKIKYVSLDFHSRFMTSSKIYQYVILNQKEPSVFLCDLSWHIPEKLDLKNMSVAAKLLIGKKDFFLFAKEPAHYESCIRHIKKISIKKKDSFIPANSRDSAGYSFIYLEFTGDGFLRSMVRNMVAILVEVGKRKIDIEKFKAILAKKVKYINNPAPAGGLYLKKINLVN